VVETFDKKGIAEAIDWIVAGSIFLIYLGLVFIFFKPGVAEVFDDGSLFEIVQDNLMQETMWEMTKVPIFIKSGPGFQGNNAKVGILLKDIGDRVDLASITDRESLPATLNNLRLYTIPSVIADYEDGNSAASGLKELPLRKEISGSLSNEGLSVNIKPTKKTGGHGTGQKKVTKLLLIASTEPLNGLIDGNEQPLAIPACQVEGEDCVLTYSVGSSELLQGINLDKYEALGGEGYATIKEKWGFPEIKEFKIIIYDADTPYNVAESEAFGAFPAPESSNIFVREFNTYQLNNDGDLVQQTVNIRIW
jgi:hypothetical protein